MPDRYAGPPQRTGNRKRFSEHHRLEFDRVVILRARARNAAPGSLIFSLEAARTFNASPSMAIKPKGETRLADYEISAHSNRRALRPSITMRMNHVVSRPDRTRFARASRESVSFDERKRKPIILAGIFGFIVAGSVYFFASEYSCRHSIPRPPLGSSVNVHGVIG